MKFSFPFPSPWASSSKTVQAPTDVNTPIPGQALLKELDDKTRTFRRADVLSSDRPDALMVHGDRRLDAQGPDGAGAWPMDASGISDSMVIMAAPQSGWDLVGFAQACVNNEISHVIDLTHDNGFAGPRGERIKEWNEEVGARTVHVAHIGMPGRSTDFQCVAIGVLGRGEFKEQYLAWSRVAPNDVDGPAPSPQVLLDACRDVMDQQPPDGSRAAFVDGNGGHVAATFAAANAIFRDHRRTPLTPDEVEQRVIAACAMLRARRSPELFSGRPELLDSLMRFAHQLLKEGCARPTSFKANEIKEMAKVPAPSENAPEFVSKAPIAPLKSKLRRTSNRGRDLATVGEQRLSPALRFEKRLDVTTFTLDSKPEEIGKVGVQGELDGEDVAKTSMSDLKTVLARVKRDQQSPDLTGHDRKALAEWRHVIEQQIAERVEYLANFDSANKNAAARHRDA